MFMYMYRSAQKTEPYGMTSGRPRAVSGEEYEWQIGR